METIKYSKTTLLGAVQKLSIVWSDDIGNSKAGHGTGFWLTTRQSEAYFITNRHNVDPSMHGHANFHLRSLTIAVRAFDREQDMPTRDIGALELSASEITTYWPNDGSDTVLLRPHRMLQPGGRFVVLCMYEDSLTYKRRPELLDRLCFVGFPGKSRTGALYDLPIARSCMIASYPDIDYSSEDVTILSKNTCLVEGLSFGGSSGSIVIRDFDEEQPEIFGIMSGHFNDEWSQTHSGLSYFTKADSIQRLLGAARNNAGSATDSPRIEQ